jgi:hypothetical protein
MGMPLREVRGRRGSVLEYSPGLSGSSVSCVLLPTLCTIQCGVRSMWDGIQHSAMSVAIWWNVHGKNGISP